MKHMLSLASAVGSIDKDATEIADALNDQLDHLFSSLRLVFRQRGSTTAMFPCFLHQDIVPIDVMLEHRGTHTAVYHISREAVAGAVAQWDQQPTRSRLESAVLSNIARDRGHIGQRESLVALAAGQMLDALRVEVGYLRKADPSLPRRYFVSIRDQDYAHPRYAPYTLDMWQPCVRHAVYTTYGNAHRLYLNHKAGFRYTPAQLGLGRGTINVRRLRIMAKAVAELQDYFTALLTFVAAIDDTDKKAIPTCTHSPRKRKRAYASPLSPDSKRQRMAA